MMRPATRKRDLAAVLVLAAIPFLVFWRIWWPDSQQRQVLREGDFTWQHYPMRTFVASELRQGRLPLWDPYTFSGEPATAEAIMASYYPLGFWEALFPRLPFVALEIEAIAHLALAAVLTFAFVRCLTGRTGPGLIAGIAFSLGGFLTSYPMLQLVILEAAVWLPASLWLLEIALPRRSLVGVAAAGVALGVCILAGHPQTFLYTAYVAFSYLLFRAWRLRLGWRFALLSPLILGAVALGVGAAQWAPALQMAPLSPRVDMGYDALSGGFQLAELWGLVRPNPQQWSPLYVGLIALGLALVGAGWRRRAETWYWAGAAAVALLISLGRNGPLYALAYRLAPGFARFRNQERSAFVVTFALAVLSGYGVLALQQRPRWRDAILIPLALLLALDLYRANASVILQAPPADGYYPTTPAVQHMQQVGDPAARMSSEGLLPGDGNAGMLYRIRDVTGNGPLYLAALDAFVENVPELRWMQLLNVQHLLTQRSIEHGAFQPVLQDGDQHLYEVHAGGKPAWISHAYVVAPSQEEAVNLTGRLAQDPMEQVVLEQVPDPAPEASSGEEEVRLVGFSQRWVAVEATLNAPGVLVLSEVQYPGWVARVNGQPATSLRAYGLLRAVSLPAGHSRVEWRFVPLVPLLGLFLSVLALLIVGSLVLWQIGALRRLGGALSVRLAVSSRVRSRPAGADPRRHTR